MGINYILKMQAEQMEYVWLCSQLETVIFVHVFSSSMNNTTALKRMEGLQDVLGLRACVNCLEGDDCCDDWLIYTNRG